MKALKPIFVLLISSVLILSCGASKKLKSAQADNQRLSGEVTELNNKVSGYEKQVSRLTNEKASATKMAADCSTAKDQLAIENNAFKKAKADEDAALAEIEKKVEDGLEKFAEAGADVEYKDGYMHVLLPDGLLFAKGSTKIGKEGVEALGIMGTIMKDYPNLNLLVVGNTDTLHVKGVADNWSLSTERANTVVRILRDKYMVDPARLVAAGRGKYNPVADNATAEGRAKNRRIDLIISLDFDEVLGLYGESE